MTSRAFAELAAAAPGTEQWPNLHRLRWSHEEVAAFYESGVWGHDDLWRRLLANTIRRGTAAAYVDDRDTISFEELRDASAGFAEVLADAGVGRGDVVGVWMSNRIEHLVARFGIAAVGAVELAIPVDTPASTAAGLLAETGSRAIVADRRAPFKMIAALAAPALVFAVEPVRGAHAIVGVRGDWRAFSGGDADAVDLLMSTSGTSGTPKLVIRTPNSFLAMARAATQRARIGVDDRVLIAAPLTQGIGYMHAIAIASIAGATYVFADSLNADTLLEHIDAHGVTVVGAAPTSAVRMIQSPRFASTNVSTVRLFACSGARLPPEVAPAIEERFGCRLFNMYGSLDVGIPTMTSPFSDSDERRWKTVGSVIDGSQFRVRDASGTPVPAGEPGEVLTRGATLAVGVFRDPDATASTFDASGWGRLGDLGTIDDAGYLRIVGRLKDVIIRGGRNISASEVEELARRHPRILDAAAVPYADLELGERCALAVVQQSGDDLTLAEITRFFDDLDVPKFKWPERVVRVDELPMDRQGKVRKSDLRKTIEGS